MIVPLERLGVTADEVLRVPERDCRLRGGIFDGHLAWVLENHGAAGLSALWSEIPARLRPDAGERFDPEAWFPFESMVVIDRLIVKLFGGDRETLRALGRFSARRNLTGKSGLRKGFTIQNHFWDARTHLAIFQNFGRCEYVPLGDSSFRMDYFDYVVRSRTFCESGLGYFEASVQILGGRNPIVEEIACQCLGDRSCTYVTSWDE
ncbi:MAG: hypothetical protein ABIT01_10810 [Thermoanaerobaculia bacterium]